MKRAATAMVVVLAAAVALSAAGAPTDRLFGEDDFKAVVVEGAVHVRKPWRTRWSTLRAGDVLPAGVILQVTQGASITLQGKNDRRVTGLDAETMEIRVTSPTTLRLSRQLLRQISLGERYVSKELAMQTAPLGDVSLFRELFEAWTKIASIAVGKMSSRMGIGSPDGRTPAGASIAVRARPLRLLYPEQDGLLVLDRFPATIAVTWVAAPVIGAEYEVYLWRAGADRGGPQRTVKDATATTLVFDEGEHFVQVRSKDGVWQSPVHRVLAVLALDLVKEQGAKGSDGSASPLAARIVPTAPPDELTVSRPRTLTVPERFTLDFAWQPAPKATTRTRYRLVIAEPGGHRLREIDTERTYARVSMPKDGVFDWHVVADDGGGAWLDGASRPRRFQIVPAGGLAVDALLRSGTGVTLLGEESF